MRIQLIEITNYKAFLGTYKIKAELASAIQAIKNLKTELAKL
jgi:hypothetical protein